MDALRQAGLEEDATAEKLAKLLRLSRDRVFFHPASADGWKDDDLKMPVFDGDVQAVASCLNPLLPAWLRVYGCGWPNLWTICRRPDDIARRLLQLNRGEDISFGAFARDIRDRSDLAATLSVIIRPGHKTWDGLKKANNPAGYLNLGLLKYFHDKDEAAKGSPAANPGEAAESSEEF